jgi:hypothetical protein
MKEAIRLGLEMLHKKNGVGLQAGLRARWVDATVPQYLKDYWEASSI